MKCLASRITDNMRLVPAGHGEVVFAVLLRPDATRRWGRWHVTGRVAQKSTAVGNQPNLRQRQRWRLPKATVGRLVLGPPFSAADCLCNHINHRFRDMRRHIFVCYAAASRHVLSPFMNEKRSYSRE